MESVGKILKNLRLEKGLSLEEVQKKTKVHLNILKAIEEDNFINLSPIYIRGFLKIYCKFLGLDPQKYIVDLKVPQPATVKLDTAGKSAAFFKSASDKLTFLKAVNKKNIITGLVVLVIIISLVGLFNFGKSISSRRHSAADNFNPPVAAAPEKAKAKKTQAKKLQDAAPAAATSKAKQSVSKTAKAVTSSGIRLSILAREDCWITLKVDGRLVFYSVLKRGKSETWQAKDKIEFSLSNAGVVDLILNGEKISSLGKKGQARKNILATKEGLKIP
ncbi:MAG: DUF4115 domain-containing protein [Candidatus Omnitrophica bacterium]|nr:DUF4115 domain-containing protein [Candidatus Omnitrophota bacterium]